MIKTLFIMLIISAFSLSMSYGYSRPCCTRQLTEKEEPKKMYESVFYPESLRTIARKNAENNPWVREFRDELVKMCDSWLKMSDDELWGLVFGNTLPRSWMVWSNGFCPSCKNPVTMYNWKIDALKIPWKVQCPHCGEFFPKNDFYKYYLSGLDEKGIFDPTKADRSLLFNSEHPDPNDPLHTFGVDDGTGYFDGQNRWRFIAAYLIYGQWKQAILGGIDNLSAAYLITGNQEYARKALILLDRLADVYPTFDFAKEGLVYEVYGIAGYLSTWHDACEEARMLAVAYDRVKPALYQDRQLVYFLRNKAKQSNLDNPKATKEDIKRNIEERILKETYQNSHKINSNYPRTELTKAIILTVLNQPEYKKQIQEIIDNVIINSTAVDGVTGEKGLANYSALALQGLASFLALYATNNPDFLPELINRHPKLKDTYKFHINTLCLQGYYPLVGDTGSFAERIGHYVGVKLSRKIPLSLGYCFEPTLSPSMFSFLWQLYEATGDEAYVQILYKENDYSTKGLPYDVFAKDSAKFQESVRMIIKKSGAEIKQASVNYQNWHLGILRSGKGENARAAWLCYDAGERHGHLNALNLGLFAKGLDLMPDFGYPPVGYGGGWESPKAQWYRATAAHNTVLVNGSNQPWNMTGKTNLWISGKNIQVINAQSFPPGYDEAGKTNENVQPYAQRYERTVALIDIDDKDSYLVDVFQVEGGIDHAKFVRSHFGSLSTQGLKLVPDSGPTNYNAQMKDFMVDRNPSSSWTADWQVEDYRKYLSPGRNIHLKYTDLTYDASAWTAQYWINAAGFDKNIEMWLPCIMIRRQSESETLKSTFVSIIEPYEGKSKISSIRRLKVIRNNEECQSCLAAEVKLTSGETDIIFMPDLKLVKGNSGIGFEVMAGEKKLYFDGEICHIRLDRKGNISRAAISNASLLEYNNTRIKIGPEANFVEFKMKNGKLDSAFSGDIKKIEIGACK